MKTLFALILSLFVFGAVHAQSKSVQSLYEKYQDEEDFFNLNLSGNFFDFADGLDFDFDSQGIKAMTKSVDAMRFFKLPVSLSTAQSDFKQLQKGLKRENYELMMEMSEKDSEILIYSKGDDIISDLVLLIGNTEEDYMVVELQGEFESEAIANSLP
ncbi:hypothetical protein GCM10007049_14170 [Echinicola pacifica]|uniref:DUF4252 domain-containing protein n=1 Tax=Echinicola pacifica TaxID=346377 RepID=A0A918PTU0_9BACT|nr:DUF4252 domain-containing protein [Echinicola pacifica]GGZ22507.1 hypothetical protein GCM10007049_14170 [Echinicola pacifica]